MFLLTRRACDTALAIALDLAAAEQRGRSFAERMADDGARVRQIGQLSNKFAGKRIADDNPHHGLDENIARLSAVMPDLVDGGIPAPHLVVFFNFYRIVHFHLLGRAQFPPRQVIC